MDDLGILQLINRALSEFGQEIVCESLPELSAACGYLAGRRIVMVDDTPIVLSAFIPSLTLATHGQARFVLHQDQDLMTLALEVARFHPFAVLLDGQLANGTLGTDLALVLRECSYEGFLVGFTSTEDLFAHGRGCQDVDAVMLKEFSKPEFVMEGLSQCLESLAFRKRTN